MGKFVLFTCMLSHAAFSFAQDWTVFNDTLVYYYEASNTSEIYTVRKEWKSIGQTDSSYHFINNLIPCDSCSPGMSGDYYYTNNGSVYGKIMTQKGDSLWFDQDVFFLNNSPISHSHPLSSIDMTIISHDHDADTILFGQTDSVRYYLVDDGTQIIQSKSFGFLQFPKQHSDSLVNYNLVGIEGVVGVSYNDYNTLFDFQIGDVLFYHDWVSTYDGVSIFYDTKTTDYTLTVVAIHDHMGKPYYEMERHGFAKEFDGGSQMLYQYPIDEYGVFYPILYFDWEIDFPGEPLRQDRFPCVNSPFTNFIQDNIFLGHVRDTVNGNYVHFAGVSDVNDANYQTFGAMSQNSSAWDFNYYYHWSGLAEYPTPYFDDPIFVSYEEGLGRTHFIWDGFEHKYESHLMGAVIDGDTLGQIAANLHEQSFLPIEFYPNPAQEFINFSINFALVEIFGSNGQLIIKDQNTSKINVADLTSGIYLIRAVDNSGVNYGSKFIKN